MKQENIEISDPKVSVIIPTFNRADLLPRAVNSVLYQTFTDYEIIIVDDCSSDNTQDVMATLSGPSIRQIRHDRNKGQSAAINTGIANARGEYVAFLDDDDEWLPNKLDGQVQILDSSADNVGLVYGHMDRIEDSTGRLIPSYRSIAEGDIFEDALALNIPGPTIVLLVRSSIARDIGGFDEDLSRYNDADFICRVSRHYHVTVFPQVVARAHFDHEHEQMGHEEPKYLADAVNFLRMHMDRFASELDERPRTLSTLFRRLARVEIVRGNRRAALSALVSAFRLDPLGVTRAVLKNLRLVGNIVSGLTRNPVSKLRTSRRSNQTQ